MLIVVPRMVNNQGPRKMHLKQQIMYPADLTALKVATDPSMQRNHEQQQPKAYSIVSPLSSQLILSSFIPAPNSESQISSSNVTKTLLSSANTLTPAATLASSLATTASPPSPAPTVTALGRARGSISAGNYERIQSLSGLSSSTISQQVAEANSRQSAKSDIPAASAQTVRPKASGHGSRPLNPSPIGNHTISARLIDLGKRLLDASRDGNLETVGQLVGSSGAPFTSDWLGTTALHLAAQSGHYEIAKILLRAGANRDAKTKLDKTALHLASQGGFQDIVDLLLVYGTDVNARDILKMTPLHWAVERNHMSIVERLLSYGADIHLENKFRLTCIDIAQKFNHLEIIYLLTGSQNKLNKIDGPNPMDQCKIRSDSFNYLGHQHLNGNYKSITASRVLANPAAGLESQALQDALDYQMVEDDTEGSTQVSPFEISNPCVDLVELEWSALRFESDFLLENDEDEEEELEEAASNEPTVGCLVKIVEELQKENLQLRQRVEQLSTK